jgi:hypothetical protein
MCLTRTEQRPKTPNRPEKTRRQTGKDNLMSLPGSNRETGVDVSLPRS